MMEDIRLSKVEILIQQKKFAEAEKILSALLSEDSNNFQLLVLLAEVHLQQDNLDKALSVINHAIGLYPDEPHGFYIKCRIALDQDNLNEAEKNINNAIELDPHDADYFALLATIKLTRKQFEDALRIANIALNIDAENILALNTRSAALHKLDRNTEAFNTIEGALREDPNNAYTHANYGWVLLERGEHVKALEHFKESLSNDPTFDYARTGMLEALKARNPIYRLFLNYSFFISNLTKNYQWGVLIGFFLGFKLLRMIANSNEALEPILTPIIIALALIAFSTWIIRPFSNLFLRFNKYGQFLLDDNEKANSNLVAISFGVSIVGAVLYFVLTDEKMLTVAGFGFTMMLPLGKLFLPSKHKHALLIYTIALGVIGLISIVFTFMNGEVFNQFTGIYLLGVIIFSWLANYFVIQEENE